jgi:hypothetical protein
MICKVLEVDHNESYEKAEQVMCVLKHLADKYKLNDSKQVQAQIKLIKECEQASVNELIDKISKKTHFVEIYNNH